jgi:outer membrane protein
MKKVASLLAVAGGLLIGAHSGSATAGDYKGDFMVRAGVSVVAPDSSAAVYGPLGRILGADAEVSTEVIPSATLTYFFTNNISAELFCCFAKHDVEGKGTLAGADLGDTWIFPPAVTLQYHFDGLSGVKPYVGAGVQYIHFFSEGRSSTLGVAKLDIDDAWGVVLQAGIDVELGQGWYLNADVKKTFIDLDARWRGTGINADVQLDPWIISAGVGYRFNLFGPHYTPSYK